MPAPIPRFTPTSAHLDRMMREGRMSLHKQRGHIPPLITPDRLRKPKGESFWRRMFVMDNNTGMPEFSKILAFEAIIVFFGLEIYDVIHQHAHFDMVSFAQAISFMFGGLALYIGVDRFFSQRFDKLHGIRRDATGCPVSVPPMMQPPVPDTPPAVPPCEQPAPDATDTNDQTASQ